MKNKHFNPAQRNQGSKESKQKTVLRRGALIRIAKESGAIDRMNELLSAAYLLRSYATSLENECDEIMQSCDLRVGLLKQLAVRNDSIFQAYTDEFNKCITDEQKRLALCEDYEKFEEVFLAFSKIEKKWEPKQIPEEVMREILNDKSHEKV